MASDKPIAMSFQLVLDEKRRLAAEVEVIWADGSTTLKRIGANERVTLHFEDLEKEAKSA